MRARLGLRLAGGDGQAESGWGAVLVVIAHYDPTPRPAKLILELHQVGLSTPLWRGARQLVLSGGGGATPVLRREWFQVPLRGPAILLSARLVGEQPARAGGEAGAGEGEGEGETLSTTRLPIQVVSELPSGPRRVVYVSSRPTRQADAAELLLPGPLAPEAHPAVEVRLPEELPPLAGGYAGTDLVVLAEADLARAGPEQRGALAAWVEDGGAVLLVPGTRAGWFESEAVLTLLGGAKVARHQVDRLPEMERRYGPLVEPGTPRPTFEVVRFEAGVPLSHLLGTGASSDFVERRRFGHTYPLLQAIRRGDGLVLVLAVDPSSVLLSRWRGGPDLLAALADSLARAGTVARRTARAEQDPYLDLRLFEDLDSNERPAGWIVIALVLVYIVLAGPVNVALVRRSGRGPALLAWTVPLCAVAFTLVVLGVGMISKGVGVVAWQGTLITATQGSSRAEAELLLSVRASAAGRHLVRAPAGVGLVRSVRLPEQLATVEVDCTEGQAISGSRLETWEQAGFTGRGQLALGGGISARQEDGEWVVHNQTPYALARVALLGPDLHVYQGHACPPGERVALRKGLLVPARRAAAQPLAEALLLDEQPGLRVSARLLERGARAALALPGPCIVARFEASPLLLEVDGERAPALDVALLVAPSSSPRGQR